MSARSLYPLLLAGIVLTHCATDRTSGPPAPRQQSYTQPLPPGAPALRPISQGAGVPDLAAAYRGADAYLRQAIDESLAWFDKPSSRRFFPYTLDAGITHERIWATLTAMRELLETVPDESAFIGEVHRMFDLYESVGCDGQGTVLFTGYCALTYPASRRSSARFAYPLYKRPDDLVTDPVSGQPLGRRQTDGRVVPYYSRREIETTRVLAGDELVWLDNPLSVYLIHVNGSAKLHLVDAGDENPTMYVGYAGKTDRLYRSLGQAMITAGLLDRDRRSLTEIKRLYQRRPHRVVELMYRNENYVFFTEYDGDEWPAGSLGVKVTPLRTLATDKRTYPRGGLVLVETNVATIGGGHAPLVQLMLDQDTGGAIAAPGRADLFIGTGPTAELLAGRQYAEGRMYYMLLKPEYVGMYAGVTKSQSHEVTK
ncbi:MAG: MltA domain-containing protein [Planctomycetota bacterium]|jgi:membrane-bound lytic murein transglycosylase A